MAGIPQVRDAAERLNAVLVELDDTAVRAPSGLPGWSRGHVLTHIANFSEAMARQVDEALAGRLIELYDGGRPAREAAIEAGAGRSAEELKQHVGLATKGLIAAWDQVDDWSRPVLHRDGTLADTVYTGWREIEIHTVDLALEPTSDQWSTEFCLDLLDFLRPRILDGTNLILQDGETRWEHGEGASVLLTGALPDLAAWFAGRTPVNELTGTPTELLPWP